MKEVQRGEINCQSLLGKTGGQAVKTRTERSAPTGRLYVTVQLSGSWESERQYP